MAIMTLGLVIAVSPAPLSSAPQKPQTQSQFQSLVKKAECWPGCRGKRLKNNARCDSC
jgi:hypothetical protein